MSKTVTNEHGTFQYNPTKLENLVVALANQWDVALSDMAPARSWSYGLFLERKARREEEKVNIWYTRNPSQAFCDRAREKTRQTDEDSSQDYRELYADTELRSEHAYITFGDVRVEANFMPKGVGIKINTEKVREVAAALDKTATVTNYKLSYKEGTVELAFNQVNPETDKESALGFLLNYFGV